MAEHDKALQRTVADVWSRPALGRDTATLLEIYPNQFSFAVLGAIGGILGLLIGYIAKNVGQTEAARSVGPTGVVVGIVCWVLCFVMLKKVFRKGSLYANERSFGSAVFDRILGQPGAPNMHLWERVGTAGALGETAAETLPEMLHEWSSVATAQVADALVKQAGVSAEAPIQRSGPATIAESLGRRIQSRGAEVQIVAQHEALVESGQAVWYDLAQEVTFRLFWPGQSAATFTAEGLALSRATVAARLTATVIQNRAGDWYILTAAIGEPRPA
ncbi:MAG: hypothetical protein IT204_00280 [Fimbriimonadaceae bacterium]|nr:hypothetical protein [Fimbriimonadaceae bacterium]